jgi:hypothetical protein
VKYLKIFGGLFLTVIMLASLSCQQEDCDGTACLNGSICNNGICECPNGYEGAACAEQETPRLMYITSVLVTRFPALENGNSWDEEDGPDIFIRLGSGTGSFYESSMFFANASHAKEYEFTAVSIEIQDVTATHILQLMDYEYGGFDQWMGEIEFIPYYSATNKFPSTIALDAGGPVAFTLSVEYLW